MSKLTPEEDALIVGLMQSEDDGESISGEGLSKIVAIIAKLRQPNPLVEAVIKEWADTNLSFKSNVLDWYPKLHAAIVELSEKAIAAYEQAQKEKQP